MCAGKAPKEWREVHTAKLDALEEYVDSLQGAPVLVAYEFRHDLARILGRLGKDTPYLGGGVSAKKASKIISDWNAEKLPVLLGHPQSMGHGLNFTSKRPAHSVVLDYPGSGAVRPTQPARVPPGQQGLAA